MSEARSAAELLRELRESQGRSLRVVASTLGVAPSHLSRVERGQRTVGQELGSKLAHYYGVSPEVLAIADGRIPADIAEILVRNPEVIDLLRAQYGDGEVHTGHS
jgi:transcriptional regulator with XRE-family HTH domain